MGVAVARKPGAQAFTFSTAVPRCSAPQNPLDKEPARPPPMTASDLQTLLSRSFEDPELEAQLKAHDADPVAIAASVGLHITAQEFAKAQESWETWRISSVHDEEF